MNCFTTWLWLMPLLFLSSVANSEENALQVFSFRSFQSPETAYRGHAFKVFNLALKKTTALYGPYEVKISISMNYRRSFTTAYNDNVDNFFFTSGIYDKEQTTKLVHSEVPFLLGVLGYRICFCMKSRLPALKNINNLNDLRKFSIGQAEGWPDVKILRNNGIKVIESKIFKSLFEMLHHNRFDLLCRGVNELKRDYIQFKHLENLTLEPNFALYYPSPRFFWTSKNNQQAMERINLGLELAYKDGSLNKMFLERYQEHIDFTHLKNRKIIQLQNQDLELIKPGYKKYFLDLRK